ncbi:MAG: rhodanese-like domain-containing protein [Candidatus Geothermincolia bacterium]
MTIRTFLEKRWVKSAAVCFTSVLLCSLCLHADDSVAAVLISVPEALEESSDVKGLTFVDVRSADAFARLRIPRSINIPLYAVKTKAFLRDKSIVLINEGFQMRPLETECEALVAGGVRSARVLEGGIAAWAGRGGSLEGDPVYLRDIRLLPQATYAAEPEREHLLTVFVGERADAAREILPGAVLVPFAAGGEEFLGRLEKAVRLAPAANVTTVLLVDEAGMDYQRLRFIHDAKRFRGERPVNFYCLADGLEGYRRFRELRIAIAAGEDKKTVGGCPTCPKGRSP